MSLSNNMKRIINWIDDLPEESREMAKRNMALSPFSSPLEIVPSLQSALLRAFIWGANYGTTDYWSKVYHGQINTLF